MITRSSAALRLGLVLAALFAGIAAANAQVVVVPVAPPPPQVEVIPVAPSPVYVWRPGHWHWTGVAYVWRPGRYVRRHHRGAIWVDGHWRASAGGWVWVPGHWR